MAILGLQAARPPRILSPRGGTSSACSAPSDAGNVTWLWTVNIIAEQAGYPLPRALVAGQRVRDVGRHRRLLHQVVHTFAALFGPTIVTVRTLTSDPIMIAETGVASAAGQPSRIADLFAGIREYGLLGVHVVRCHRQAGLAADRARGGGRTAARRGGVSSGRLMNNLACRAGADPGGPPDGPGWPRASRRPGAAARSRLVILAAAVAAAAIVVTVGRFVSPGPAPARRGHVLPTSPASYLGVYESGPPQTYQPVAEFAGAVGRAPNLVGYYSGWREPFKTSFARDGARTRRGHHGADRSHRLLGRQDRRG